MIADGIANEAMKGFLPFTFNSTEAGPITLIFDDSTKQKIGLNADL
jgi:hypothetical protein